MTDNKSLAERLEAEPVKRAIVAAICKQQMDAAGECSCMADGGMGFGKVPAALLCRDTYEEIWDAIRPAVIEALRHTPQPASGDVAGLSDNEALRLIKGQCEYDYYDESIALRQRLDKIADMLERLAGVTREPEGEDVCANCKGVIADLACGRDPDELCDTCYEDSQAAIQPTQQPGVEQGHNTNDHNSSQWLSCHKNTCHRNERCMYTPCLNT